MWLQYWALHLNVKLPQWFIDRNIYNYKILHQAYNHVYQPFLSLYNYQTANQLLSPLLVISKYHTKLGSFAPEAAGIQLTKLYQEKASTFFLAQKTPY